LETNDNRFDENRGFSSANDFAQYMNDCFDLLYEEGAEAPKLMSVAVHDRLIGRPGRAIGLISFLEHARKHDRVWFCTGREIAEHWRKVHPSAQAETLMSGAAGVVADLLDRASAAVGHRQVDLCPRLRLVRAKSSIFGSFGY